MLTAVVCCGIAAGCGAEEESTSVQPTFQANSQIEYWVPTPEEEAVLLDCAAEKIGYAYTLDDIVDPDMSDGEGIVDTEEEWEGQRMTRAYEQCWFENYPDPDELDRADEMTDAMYRAAYGIRWGETEPHGDPLAPWPGEENLGWD